MEQQDEPSKSDSLRERLEQAKPKNPFKSSRVDLQGDPIYPSTEPADSRQEKEQ